MRTALFLAIVPFCFSHGPLTFPGIFSEGKDQHSEEIPISSQLGSTRQLWPPVQQRAPSARVQTCHQVYSNRAGLRDRERHPLARERAL